MKDIKLAEKNLKEGNFNLVIVKDGEIIFASRLEGVKGPLKAIEELGHRAESSSVADRIVGRAVAFLFAYMGVDSVFGLIMSNGAEEVLEDNEIEFRFGETVPKILGEEEQGTCTWERVLKGVEDPKEAYKIVKSKAFETN